MEQQQERTQIGTDELLAAIGHLYVENRVLRAALVRQQQEYTAPNGNATVVGAKSAKTP